MPRNYGEVLILSIFVYLLVQPIGNGSGCRLIDDTENIEARDGTSILGGLALGVIEVGRHSNNCIVYSLEDRERAVRPVVQNWLGFN